MPRLLCSVGRLSITVTFLVMLYFVVGASLTLAQGIIIDPPPGGPPLPRPLVAAPIRIEQQRVDVAIDGPLAQVHLTQVIRNHSAQTVEGSYVFPLPADAAISDFQMTVDGQVIEGQILTKEEARRTYEEIVRQQRDPALLQYIGHDLFQVNVFPIPAGATRKLELNYSQILEVRDGLYQFRYPLQMQQTSAAPIQSLEIAIAIRNQPGLRTIYSPNYEITVARISDANAQVSYQATDVRPDQDFVLYFGADEQAVGLNLLSYKPAGEDGYFVLLAAPSVETAADAIVERDLIMVLDISGSMQGEKIEQAKAAAHYVVDHLNGADRFNLIAFSTGVRLWQTQVQSVTTANLQDAHDWIDTLTATGSTDINRALLEALAQLGNDQATRPAYLLFLTDGLPTQGETDIARILDNARNNRPAAVDLRLFPFGVGFDVNTELLDTLSRELGGRSSYVQPDERIDEEVSHFYAAISTPVLTDVTLEFAGEPVVDELYPTPLPDLFAGEQLVIAGRYHTANAGAGTQIDVTLRGKINGTRITYRYPAQAVAAAGGEPAVARLWAARKISALIGQVRATGPVPELIDAIVELSLQYGIVTPYTAAFVPEPGIVLNGAPNQLAPGGSQDGDVLSYAPQELSREQVANALSDQMQTDSYAKVGEAAVAASVRLDELANASVIQNEQMMRFSNERTFIGRNVVEGREQSSEQMGLTLWVDTLYTDDMTLETVQFGGDCYFALAEVPQVAAWLALSPDIIIVRDAKTALRITTVPTTLQEQTCPVWSSDK